MSRTRLWSVAALALVTLGGCGADPTDSAANGGNGDATDEVSNKITGSVREWAVDVSAGKAEAGEVVFAIANFGSITHEFLVVKTDFEPGKIPLGDNNRFAEDGEGIEVIDEIPEWDVNDAKVLKVSLDAGNYQLLCNIEGHYKSGMFHAFEVVEGDSATSPEGEGDGTSSDGDAVSNDITGEVKDFAIGIDAGGAKAGDVKFTVTNNGTIAHEFLVVKTDVQAGKIPLTEEKKFSEDNPDLTVIDEIPEWEPGETKTLTVKLDPGSYQIVCNIVDHYKAGMWLPFTVAA